MPSTNKGAPSYGAVHHACVKFAGMKTGGSLSEGPIYAPGFVGSPNDNHTQFQKSLDLLALVENAASETGEEGQCRSFSDQLSVFGSGTGISEAAILERYTSSKMISNGFYSSNPGRHEEDRGGNCRVKLQCTVTDSCRN